MDKLRSYFIKHISILFFSIFMPLFTIASVIFLIKLASLTAVIELSMLEMGELYLFVLPELLFFTLPIAFVVASILALYKLSNDNELTVVFALGISPEKILRMLAIPSLLLSSILLFDYLYVTPYIKNISSNFISHKKSEAKFNLTASEFGHSFGEWMLFINDSDKDKRLYTDVVLFNKDVKNEILIRAQKGEMINQNNNLQLKLTNGHSYSFDDKKFQKMFFETGYINDIMSSENEPYINAYDYWTNELNRDKKNQRLVINTLIGLFPLTSLFLIGALGVVHARHQKRWIYLWMFLSIVGYYAASVMSYNWISFHAIWVVITLWVIITYSFYRRLVGIRF